MREEDPRLGSRLRPPTPLVGPSGEPRAEVSRRCALCDRLSPTTAPCYLQPTRQAYEPGTYRSTWWNVRCLVCDPCYLRGRWITLRRHLLAWYVIGFFVLGCGGGVALVTGLGVPKPIQAVVYPAVIGLAALNFAVCLVYVIRVTGRDTRAWLGPRVDERMRAVTGGRGWGYLNQVSVTRELPEGESYVDLDRL